ncbi:magnesium transporter [Thermodesulfovibrionales bacterium]|nr:magnesium transporter [Thermodesulfovibrionales bacterium]
MPLFGDLFLSEVIKKPVFDPKGDVIGRVKDIVVVKGDPLPMVSAIILERKRRLFRVKWDKINLFNKRIISTYLTAALTESYSPSENDIMARRDILDKRIVDVNGVRVVTANDIKLEGRGSDALLVAVDVGVRGLLRRAGISNGKDGLLKLFRIHLTDKLISWKYIQPIKPALKTIALTVPHQMISELHPADVADIISQISQDEVFNLFRDFDIKTAAAALRELKPDMQIKIIDTMDIEKSADVIEEMPPDNATDILNNLPVEKARKILEQIRKKEAEDIQELLGHKEDTAGGLMTNKFVSYGPEITTKEIIERFRRDAMDIEAVYYIYVIDSEERLLGVLSLRELLLTEPHRKLSEVMETKIIKVSPHNDAEIVAEMMSKYDLVSMPVVDSDEHLLGIITVDDIMDVMEAEATEDIYRIAGTSEVRFGNIEGTHSLNIVKSRLPWLLLCLVGGLISSVVIGQFEEILVAIVMLAAFIPVIMGMAGNTGLQIATTLVRNIALDSIDSYWKYIAKELLAGFMIASLTGAVIGVTAAILKGMPILGLVVGISMFLAICSSTIFALIAPTLATKAKIDPAITSGPFVTVYNDILALTIYFMVATIFMKYLV